MSAPGPEGGLDRFCTGGRHWAPDTHDDVVAPAGAAILAPTDRVTACDQQHQSRQNLQDIHSVKP